MRTYTHCDQCQRVVTREGSYLTILSKRLCDRCAAIACIEYVIHEHLTSLR